MPYVSHTHTLVQYTRSPTHSATVLTRSVCPSHVYCTSRSCHCLLACFFSRSDFETTSHEKLCRSETRAGFRDNLVLEIHLLVYRIPPPPCQKKRIRVERKPTRNRSFTSFTHPPILRHCYIYCSM